MVKVRIITVYTPDCFIGIDTVLSNKVNKAFDILKNQKASLLPCTNVDPHMVVLCNLNNELVRLRVLSVVNPNTYKCLLIDHGRIEEVQKHKLFAIPANELQIDPAVKLYKIPGIRPAGLNLLHEGIAIRASLSESKEWIPASYKFVSRIFRENSLVNVSYIKEYSKDKAFVKVEINYKNVIEDLKDLLIREKYAFVINEEIDNGASCFRSHLSLEDTKETSHFPYSLSCESLSKILETSQEDDNISVSDICESTSCLNIEPENYDSLTTYNSTGGTLDEISAQILDNKVKSWFVLKSTETNENKETVIKYEYKNTIRPILSYQKDEMIATFLKDALVHHKTKLLLLIQSLMIPAILRGINLVAIAPSKKGKSLGMLMPILQKIASKPISKSRSFNPIAIIICSSWMKVKELSDSANLLLGFLNESSKLRRPTIVSAYAGPSERKIMIPILAGCDILIITPKCLLRLLKSHEFFKLNELEIMGLDDAEILIAYHLNVLKEIFIYKQSGMYESGNGVHQIVTATNWTSGLQSFVKNEMGDMFMVTVNNPLEIAVFERLEQKLVEYDSSLPMGLYHKLLTYLEMNDSTIKRTIIFASDDETIVSIYKFLNLKTSFDMKLMLGSMSGPMLKQTEQEWNQYRGYVNMPVLLISDEALGTCDISIFNAHTLLHADIRANTFGPRLNFLRGNFSQLSFLHQDTTKDQSVTYHSFVFVSPSSIDLTNANFLYKFLGRCHCDRPVWLQEKAIDYILNKEKSKVVNEICSQIKVKGECEFPGCDKRHIVLSDIDKPLLPNRGQIKFRLLYLRSPSNFYVRILEHKVVNESNDNHYKSQYTSLKMNIIKYFSDPKNIQGVNPKYIQPGFIAAIRLKDILERVMVIKKNEHKSIKMTVKLIDHGSTITVEQSDLLMLPKSLKDVPEQAVEVFVIGIRPLDNDEHYHEESCKFAQQFLDNKDLFGVIMLCIGKTMWLDSVTQFIHHKTTNISVYEKSLSIELTETAFAEKNPGHIQRLIRLCTGKIDIWNCVTQPDNQKPVPIMRKFTYTKEPMYFEELTITSEDAETTNDCTVTRVISPNIMFLSNRDTKESIKQMQKEIKLLIDSIETMPMRNLKICDCILFCHNSDWLRGYVLKVDTDSVLIFSLDWGTIVSYSAQDYDLKKLPTEYQELPYHAIIAGLCYCNAEQPFSDDVNTIIENFVSDSDKKILLTVTAHSVENLNSGTMFIDDNGHPISFHHLDIWQSMRRYTVTIDKQLPHSNTEELFNVLVQRGCVVPSKAWILTILPESDSVISRLERSGSVPHLAFDILSSRDAEKRLKLSVAIERIIVNNIKFFEDKGFVSEAVEAMLNTLFVLIHFVSEQPVFMCYYRSLTALLNFAYTSRLPRDSTYSEKEFTITYISNILYSFQSIMSHILSHFNMTIKNNKLDDGSVFLEMLKLLLVNSGFANNLFEEDSWVCVMATCVSVLQCNDSMYNRLMDILVQLVMLTQSEEPILAGIVTQCCKAISDSESLSVWVSSMALVSCVVNCKLYYSVFRDLGFFSALLDKTIRTFYDGGRCWTEAHESSIELLLSMWHNGGVDRGKALAGRDLIGETRAVLEALGVGHDSVARFVSDLMMENSRQSDEQASVAMTVVEDSVAPPDTDVLDWDLMKNDKLLMTKHRRCYKKIFEEKDESADSGDDRRSSVQSDSDSSNVDGDPFLSGTKNPADEDNVLCYDLP